MANETKLIDPSLVEKQTPPPQSTFDWFMNLLPDYPSQELKIPKGVQGPVAAKLSQSSAAFYDNRGSQTQASIDSLSHGLSLMKRMIQYPLFLAFVYVPPALRPILDQLLHATRITVAPYTTFSLGKQAIAIINQSRDSEHQLTMSDVISPSTFFYYCYYGPLTLFLAGKMTAEVFDRAVRWINKNEQSKVKSNFHHISDAALSVYDYSFQGLVVSVAASFPFMNLDSLANTDPMSAMTRLQAFHSDNPVLVPGLVAANLLCVTTALTYVSLRRAARDDSIDTVRAVMRGEFDSTKRTDRALASWNRAVGSDTPSTKTVSQKLDRSSFFALKGFSAMSSLSILAIILNGVNLAELTANKLTASFIGVFILSLLKERWASNHRNWLRFPTAAFAETALVEAFFLPFALGGTVAAYTAIQDGIFDHETGSSYDPLSAQAQLALLVSVFMLIRNLTYLYAYRNPSFVHEVRTHFAQSTPTSIEELGAQPPSEGLLLTDPASASDPASISPERTDSPNTETPTGLQPPQASGRRGSLSPRSVGFFNNTDRKALQVETPKLQRSSSF